MKVVFTILLLVVTGWTQAYASGAKLKTQATGRPRNKRELPLNIGCDVRSTSDDDKCYKGDLISETVADCKREASWYNVFTCDPKNKYSWSTSVDVPDVDEHGVDCEPETGLPVTCGTQDTRCVCDAPWDFTSPVQRPYFANHCRCQYWPLQDVRESRPAVCKQYDHGGESDIHFYACCNNCLDPGDASDRFCDGDTYQGGGTTNGQCGKCGQRLASQADSRLTYTFNCESCQQQRDCRDICDNLHPIAKTTPGLCPLWVGCFRGCCLNVNPTFRGKRSTPGNVTNFCGDNTCSAGETRDNCPSDCCPTVNRNCALPPGQCRPRCCLDWGCCLVNQTTVTVMTQTPSKGCGLLNAGGHILAVLPLLLVIINF